MKSEESKVNRSPTPKKTDDNEDDRNSFMGSNLDNTARINLMIKKEEQNENKN
jgi:hypothetical protein